MQIEATDVFGFIDQSTVHYQREAYAQYPAQNADNMHAFTTCKDTQDVTVIQML